MIKVTVAIPIYNAAKHLDVMFDSLMHQTMAAADFEVICVNDCSTDNSREVIEKYNKMMGNIVLIDRTENSGSPSIPRNNAIDAARGEYLHFLDNDDFLGEEALDRLYQAAEKYQSDVIFGRYVGVNGRYVPGSMFKKGNRPKADIIEDDLVYSLAPHKMFRLSFLREHGLRMHPEATAGNDDLLFVMQCYVAARVTTVLADYDYYFVVARGGENLSKKVVPADKYLFVWYRTMEFLTEFIPDEHYRKKVKVAYLDRFLKTSRFRSYLLTSMSTYEQKKEWLNETKRFFDAHMDDQLIQSLDPQFHSFWQAVKENDIEKLAKVQLRKYP